MKISFFTLVNIFSIEHSIINIFSIKYIETNRDLLLKKGYLGVFNISYLGLEMLNVVYNVIVLKCKQVQI